MTKRGAASEFLLRCATRYRLRGCTVAGDDARVVGRLWIHGGGVVRVGHRVFFDAATAPIEIYAWPCAEIVFGDDCYVGGGTSIEATQSIAIGDRSRLFAFCKVIDNHFHPLVGDRHARPAPRPVVIERDVSVGPRSIVLAGSRIGRGERVPAGTIVKGAPASASAS